MSIEVEVIEGSSFCSRGRMRIKCRNIIYGISRVRVWDPESKEEEDRRTVELLDLAMRILCKVEDVDG